MNFLRQALADYLAVRRVLGYRLARAEKLLAQFLAFVEDRGEEHLTIETALAWAMVPTGADPNWMSRRLSVVRRFAVHLRGIDPATQVPPADMLPGRTRRATPYLYSTEEIAALMAVTTTLRGLHRKATYRTLIGLLAVTGMRVGEAIGLNRDDFDAICGMLTIRNGKFGKSRELPCIRARSPPWRYLRRAIVLGSRRTSGVLPLHGGHEAARHERAEHLPPACSSRRPQAAFGVMSAEAARSSTRLCGQHLLDAYRDGDDPGARLAILSTYLGHVDPVHTYWYLSASPELLMLAGDRLERHLRGDA